MKSETFECLVDHPCVVKSVAKDFIFRQPFLAASESVFCEYEMRVVKPVQSESDYNVYNSYSIKGNRIPLFSLT